MPDAQVSAFVQASLSSQLPRQGVHALALDAGWQRWQTSPGFDAPGAQQDPPITHPPATAVWTQPRFGSQLSFVQLFLSSQRIAPWSVHLVASMAGWQLSQTLAGLRSSFA